MTRKKGSVGKARSIEAEDLREVLKPIYDELEKAGVSDAQLPSNEALASKLLDFHDHAKVKKWVKEYAAVMKK